VTVTLRSIEEAKNQLEKLNIAVNSAEKFTNKKTYLKVLSVEYTNEEVANYLKEKCKEEGIYLILGREYSLGVPLY
jgi:chromosome segregation ATPase